MEKDLRKIKKILKDLHYTETYSVILLNHIIEKFNDSGLESITPNFLYYSLVNNEGKETAKKIANKFDDMKNPNF